MPGSYLEYQRSGRLKRVIEEFLKMLESCQLCPRRCGVNRLKNEKGFCRTGLAAIVYSFLPHHGEEPPLSARHGSGTIFFSHCNMACVYCQNYEFSQVGKGSEVSSQELADYMLELQQLGCHNINLVTPTHVLPQILQSLDIAIMQGLKIPLVYNTGGYDLAEVIKLLDGIVDIYLPDMRYADESIALRYSCAPDYPRYNRESVKEMHRQVGVAEFDAKGVIKKGLIIRHLVLPDDLCGTPQIMQFIATELSPDTYISLMSQYFPCHKADKFQEISRRITNKEYLQAQKAMYKYGLYNGWIQNSRGLDRFVGIHIKSRLKKNYAT